MDKEEVISRLFQRRIKVKQCQSGETALRHAQLFTFQFNLIYMAPFTIKVSLGDLQGQKTLSTNPQV